MAGNIGVELYLAVGKMKSVLPNFNHFIDMLNPYSANIKSANTCLQHTFAKYNPCQYFWPYGIKVCRESMHATLLNYKTACISNHFKT